eukprot:scaffold72883_cov28-Phaeocystis_antarctica.AAC.1
MRAVDQSRTNFSRRIGSRQPSSGVPGSHPDIPLGGVPNVSDTLQNCDRRCSAVPWTLPVAIAVAESPGRPLQLPPAAGKVVGGKPGARGEPMKCPCCASLLLSRALSFGLGHSTGCRERALKVEVSSVEFNVDKIRTAATPYWNNPHANLDPPTRLPSLSSVLTHFARYAPAYFLKASLYPSTLTPSSP